MNPEQAPYERIAHRCGALEFYADEFSKILRTLLESPVESDAHRYAVHSARATLNSYDKSENVK